ncbi:hypothetical protein FDP41_006272 [Naegleria fowleri]|uniref:Uncharacterized protein n=1 Tax=Naegleria fowleri TaxID=5763 RepID=A0A6A5BKU8_NAEFO|nr:uncharacterized protein FDP41_006272 [Naegleria fowleri]KAF0974798.1 hypothetical protein FDP41_006272 [Naegleria fowleri]
MPQQYRVIFALSILLLVVAFGGCAKAVLTEEEFQQYITNSCPSKPLDWVQWLEEEDVLTNIIASGKADQLPLRYPITQPNNVFVEDDVWPREAQQKVEISKPLNSSTTPPSPIYNIPNFEVLLSSNNTPSSNATLNNILNTTTVQNSSTLLNSNGTLSIAINTTLNNPPQIHQTLSVTNNTLTLNDTLVVSSLFNSTNTTAADYNNKQTNSQKQVNETILLPSQTSPSQNNSLGVQQQSNVLDPKKRSAQNVEVVNSSLQQQSTNKITLDSRSQPTTSQPQGNGAQKTQIPNSSSSKTQINNSNSQQNSQTTFNKQADLQMKTSISSIQSQSTTTKQSSIVTTISNGFDQKLQSLQAALSSTKTVSQPVITQKIVNINKQKDSRIQLANNIDQALKQLEQDIKEQIPSNPKPDFKQSLKILLGDIKGEDPKSLQQSDSVRCRSVCPKRYEKRVCKTKNNTREDILAVEGNIFNLGTANPSTVNLGLVVGLSVSVVILFILCCCGSSIACIVCYAKRKRTNFFSIYQAKNVQNLLDGHLPERNDVVIDNEDDNDEPLEYQKSSSDESSNEEDYVGALDETEFVY